VGGIEAVTLSDEEARRRGTQKTVLERRAPPTFDVLIEIQSRDEFTVHADIAASVDAFLRGYPLPPEVRTRDEEGKIRVEKAAAPSSGSGQRFERARVVERTPIREGGRSETSPTQPLPSPMGLGTVQEASTRVPLRAVKIYPYGVARNRLMQSAKRIGVPAVVVRTIDEADALITLRSYYRDHQATIVEAEQRGMPIYVLRANTVNQIEQFLADLFNLPGGEGVLPGGGGDEVRNETQAAIAAVLNGERYVDMPPAGPIIRRIQHEMARAADLVSHSYGKEPRRHVRIFRD